MIIFLVAVTCLGGAVLLTYLNSNSTDLGSKESQASGAIIVTFPAFSITKGEERILSDFMKFSSWSWRPELSPSIIMQPDGSYIYTVSTHYSYKCKSNTNLLSGSLVNESSNCNLITKPTVIQDLNLTTGNPVYNNPSNLPTDTWNFTYNGVISAAVVSSNGQKKVVAVMHNEAQNAEFDGKLYQQPFLDVSASKCAARYVNGKYEACWDSFLGFVSIKTADYDNQTGWSDTALMNDEGPVLWPSKPYIGTDGKRTGSGAYQTTMFVDGEYIYLFSQNHSKTLAPGAWSCLTVSRSPISTFGKAGTWKNYYNGSFSVDSLPAGLTKDNFKDYLTVSGGPSDCINVGTPLTHAPYYFSVAKVKGTPYYIAAEEGSIADPDNIGQLKTWRIVLRVSKDLINWSDGYVFATANSSWGEGKYAYPTFVDKTGKSTTEIDPDEFYIVGKHATASTGYELYSTKLSMVIRSVPPVDKSEELVKNYYKGFLGWDVDANFDGFSTHLNNVKKDGCYRVIKDFSQSEVFINGNKKDLTNEDYVKLLYRTVLAREPDGREDGSKWWVARLTAGDLNRDTIIDKLFEGWEPDSVCSSGKVFVWTKPPSGCLGSCSNKLCGENNGCGDKCIVQSCGADKICSSSGVCEIVPVATTKVGDIDKNGSVDLNDYTFLLIDYKAYKTTGALNVRSDFNSDSKVDLNDYTIFLIAYRKDRS